MPTEAAQAEFDKLFAEARISDRHPEDIRGSSQIPNDSRANQLSSSRIRGTQFDSDSDFDDNGPSRNFSTAISGNKMRSRYYIPSMRSEANTGPKGVIADAQAFEDAKRAAKHASIFQRGRDALTRRTSRSPSSNNNNAQQPTLRPYDNNRSSVSGEDASDEDDEGGFMTQWRQGRLRELQDTYDGEDGVRAGRRRSSPSVSRRIWGSLVTVSAEGYLDAIEKVGRDVVVVVLIYDDLSEVSRQVEACVRKLAWQYQTTRFIKLHYEEAEMEVAGVPAILAYRGGDKFAGLVPVIDEIPETDELSADSVGAALRRHKVL